LCGNIGILQYAAHSYKGVDIANDVGVGNYINLSVPQSAGLLEVVDFTNSGGYNIVNVQGYRQNASVIAGTPLTTDQVDIQVNGTGGAYNDPWQTYTPTVTSGTGSLTTVSATGRYKKHGSVIHFSMAITLTNIGTGATNIQCTLPVSALAQDRSFGSGRESASSGDILFWWNTTTRAIITKDDGTFPGVNGYVLNISGSYEVA